MTQAPAPADVARAMFDLLAKGRPVSARTAKGPIRLALPARLDGSAPTAETPDA